MTFLKQQIFLLAIIFSSLLLLIVTTFLTSDVDYDQPTLHEVSFGVVVDCGSSGTRAHVFKFEGGNHQTTKQIDLVRDNHRKPLNKHIVPGLSSFRDRPDNASEYMEPIMDFISDSIPYDHHIATPIYFMATAGMRLIDESSRKNILNDITRDLRAKYNFPRIKSQVITGQQEGAYSWMSVNVDRFYNATAVQPTSVGIIEMGGASVQVTFEINDEIEKTIHNDLKDIDVLTTFRSEQIRLELPIGVPIKLSATSFLGLGVNSARESAIDLLVRDYFNGTGQLGRQMKDLDSLEVNLNDPCLPIGSNENVLRPPGVITDPNKNVGFVMNSSSGAFKVKLEGSGNFLNCLTLLERVIKAIKKEGAYCLNRARCTTNLLGTSFIPYRLNTFVGLSEMFFTTNEIMNLAGPFNRSRVLRETNRICSTEFALLQLNNSRTVSHEDRVLYECFKASWLLTILHNFGLKMPVEYENFKTIERIHDREIDWTFGAMLWETLSQQRDV